MNLQFYKYHGTGNDFILIDNREGNIKLSEAQVAKLCHRHFGIGADGLMLLENCAEADFRMVYYNSDGRQSSMCGNGGRCIVAFANSLGAIGNTTSFMAIDGLHDATILGDGTVSLGMKNVDNIAFNDGHAMLDTGSPHRVQWVEDVDSINVFTEGRLLRNEAGETGVNVNFTQKLESGIAVRTYERGVEEETLSCGTGVCAAAIASTGDEVGQFEVAISTPGGSLLVTFLKESAGVARKVRLMGSAVRVFGGGVEGG